MAISTMRAGALQSDRKVEHRGAVLDVSEARKRGPRAVRRPELTRRHGQLVASEAACAPDLDANGQRRVRATAAPAVVTSAYARIGGRVVRRGDGVNGNADLVGQ